MPRFTKRVRRGFGLCIEAGMIDAIEHYVQEHRSKRRTSEFRAAQAGDMLAAVAWIRAKAIDAPPPAMPTAVPVKTDPTGELFA